ncbi:helix-turn-helix domain-containing protein [Amycolatopsis carbonis]|uniref:Helix-turn-helix domain-containing protein n=1 Tax=Amycolatopsis carbonis TaxID=715471 RepID=A0A9Y2MVA8_9PSEU|nr:helix-turn-helix domain-containing protein [Amycolatopsis sp. 2-15]WIX76542.1 helix-turn-helix domain-containing protein [Amycolatopsis sp. 2-15]
MEEPSSWSTEDVAAPDAFGYWSDVICDTLVQVAARATGEAPFAGRLEHAALDGVGLSTIASGPQEVARTKRLIARDPEEYLLVNVQPSGRSLAQQDGRTAALESGTMTVLDSSRPYRLQFAGAFSQVILRVPRTLLPARVAAGGTAVALDGRGPGRLVAEFLAGLARQQREDPEVAAALLPHAVGLLETALGWAARGTTPTSAALSRERIRRFVRQHLAGPALDAGAAGCGLSRRSVYRALAEGGESLTALTRRLRVARARRLLRDRPDLPVAAIAAQSGFGGAAQLHRAFAPSRARHRGPTGPTGPEGQPISSRTISRNRGGGGGCGLSTNAPAATS